MPIFLGELTAVSNDFPFFLQNDKNYNKKCKENNQTINQAFYGISFDKNNLRSFVNEISQIIYNIIFCSVDFFKINGKRISNL